MKDNLHEQVCICKSRKELILMKRIDVMSWRSGMLMLKLPEIWPILEEKKKLNKYWNDADSLISTEHMPYAMPARENEYHDIVGMVFLEACYKAGDSVLAKKIRVELKKDLTQQKNYYDYLKALIAQTFLAQFDGRDGDAARNAQFLQLLDLLRQRYEPQSTDKTCYSRCNY